MDSVDRSWTGVPAWPGGLDERGFATFRKMAMAERHCGACLVQMCPPLLAGEVFRTRWHETELLSEDGRQALVGTAPAKRDLGSGQAAGAGSDSACDAGAGSSPAGATGCRRTYQCLIRIARKAAAAAPRPTICAIGMPKTVQSQPLRKSSSRLRSSPYQTK